MAGGRASGGPGPEGRGARQLGLFSGQEGQRSGEEARCDDQDGRDGGRGTQRGDHVGRDDEREAFSDEHVGRHDGSVGRRDGSVGRRDGSVGRRDGSEGRRGASSGSPRGASSGGPRGVSSGSPVAASAIWDDGLIARRAREGDEADAERRRAVDAVLEAVYGTTGAVYGPVATGPRKGGRDHGSSEEAGGGAYERTAREERHEVAAGLRPRLEALRELIGLSRTRLDGRTLAEASRVLDAAEERARLSGEHTVVAIAGATGSGKSSLFNALVGAQRSEVGARRPTTAEPVACVWAAGERSAADGLLRRLAVPARRRHAPLSGVAELRGLVLLDLPDHDSAATGHREQVDRLLELVDAVIWVVDPEKYADAVLHERYLRPLAGYAEVSFIVLNQVDRLPGEAADQVVDDLRRLLDEDGVALGEHGEPGATVLALSAATGEGVGELRELLGRFVAGRQAADRRLAADVDAAAARLRTACAAEGQVGLTERARTEFEDRLAEAVGAVAIGCVAERDWLRCARRAYGLPWRRPAGVRTGLWAVRRAAGRMVRWAAGRSGTGTDSGTGLTGARHGQAGGGTGYRRGAGTVEPGAVDGRAAARPVVEQAVRAVAAEAAYGLPAPWAQAVREAAERGAYGLPEALDEVVVIADAALRTGPSVRPRWWAVAAAAQAVLLVLQAVGLVLLLGAVTGLPEPAAWWVKALLPVAVGTLGGPLVAWVCGVAARGPARRYGHEAEQRLRTAAAGCGRARVLEPVAAELLRYREVRERYAVAAGF
ncbi:GTPase [Streptomyces sp. NPDC003077]|uniref:GTPase n=1 Tax=Streptomyces sp. NPDC003077 TaxID=3154443 RepID=UPI0033B42CE4